MLENGTAYRATVETSGDQYAFWGFGTLGERVPLQVDDISVTGEDGAVDFQQADAGTITFPEGNYTVSYQGPIRDNHLQAFFSQPYAVTVTLPPGLDVRNPLLGMISPGGAVQVTENETVEVVWDRTTLAELRFYDPGREILLNTFGTIWVVMGIVMLFPYLLTRMREE